MDRATGGNLRNRSDPGAATLEQRPEVLLLDLDLEEMSGSRC
jgi:hypothetical protein